MAECACVLSLEHSFENRAAALDALQAVQVVDIMYIDDVVAPASSASPAARVIQVYEAFTKQFGSRFNIGLSKTAIMGPMGDLCTDLNGVDAFYMGEPVEGVDIYSSWTFRSLWSLTSRA